MKRPHRILLGIAVIAGSLAAGAGVGWLLRGRFPAPPSTAAPIYVKNDPYKLVQPLLGFRVSSNKADFQEYKPLEAKLQALIDAAKKDGDAAQVSVYFRDMTTGHWTGIDETQSYTPASLYKIPVLIAYLKAAEDYPEMLARTVQISSFPVTPDDNQDIPPPEAIKPNGTYTVAELLSYMIEDSDNNALEALTALTGDLDVNSFNEVKSDLGLPVSDKPEDERITPKQYSLFFRVLYNATYLGGDASEKALELLSQSKFRDGLRADIPDDIVIAHKFGEAAVGGQDAASTTGRELHDCGIVYAKKSPYFLCVMTKGDNIPKLESVIKGISDAVYQDATKK